MSNCADGFTELFFPSPNDDNLAGLGYDTSLCANLTEFTPALNGGTGENATGWYIEEIGEEEAFPEYFHDMNVLWILVAGCMVFLMQAGFAMLEAGSVGAKNTINILFKNLLDVCLGAIAFWAIGYGIAYGDTAGEFFGKNNFFLKAETSSNTAFEGFFFQFAFAATAATIVSGSVAERTKFTAYFIYSIVITSIIYPVVVHWGWGGGFMSAFGPGVTFMVADGDEPRYGFVDYAGSGIVHMTGGFAGLVGAIVVGPRAGRFSDEKTKMYPFGKPNEMQGHSFVLASLGVIILWFGWYGFNAGSTLCAGECMLIAGKIATTTTLSAAAATVTGTFTEKVLTGKWDLAIGLNCVIAGLVSITAPCSVVEPWAAVVIGMIGAFVYLGASRLLKMLHIDDPLDACPLHGFCGIWGCLSVGIFATDELVFNAYGNEAGAVNDAVSSGFQFLTQAVGVACILAWVVGTSAITFVGINLTIGMRVDEETEKAGLDASEHGAQAYLGFEDQ